MLTWSERTARRWPIAAVIVLATGCSTVLGFKDGELATSGASSGDGGEGGDALEAPGEASLESGTESGFDAPFDGSVDGVADASVDAGGGDAGTKQAFETSGIFNGRLDLSGIPGPGGLAAADLRCMEAAQAAFPGRTFVAWLSTTGASAVSRVAGGGPWYVGGAYLGSVLQLTVGNLKTPLDKDPSGVTVPSPPVGVWTGTEANGTSALQNCTDWSAASNAVTGWVGTGGGGDTTWTNAAVRDCSSAYHLYCFEM